MLLIDILKVIVLELQHNILLFCLKLDSHIDIVNVFATPAVFSMLCILSLNSQILVPYTPSSYRVHTLCSCLVTVTSFSFSKAERQHDGMVGVSRRSY